MSTNPTKLTSPNRIRTYLTRKVYFNSAVDGNDFRITSDHMRIIHIIYIQKYKSRIIIHVIIQPAGTHRKTSHGFIGMYFLFSVIDHIIVY